MLRLDEIQHFLDHDALSRLLGLIPGSGTTVLGTIHTAAYEEQKPDSDIRSAIPVRLERLLSPAERERAEAAFPDPQLHTALDRHGLAEYLATGADPAPRQADIATSTDGAQPARCRSVARQALELAPALRAQDA